MLGKLPKKGQQYLFHSMLKYFINKQHELFLLVKKIDWSYFEKEFVPLYSKRGAPSVDVRLIVYLPLLKYPYNHIYKCLTEHWVRDVYFQSFCREEFFEHEFPFTPREIVHFCNRLKKKRNRKNIFVQRTASR